MKSNAFIKLFLSLYLITLSWTGVFKITPLLTIPLLMFFALILISIALIVGGRRGIVEFDTCDLILFLYLVWILTNSLFQINIKTTNYLLVYFIILGGNLFYLKNIIINTDISSEQLLKWVAVGVTFIQVFVLVEIVSKQVFGFDVAALLPREKEEITATYMGFLNRGYGFATEPGTLSNYLNVFSPLAIYYFFRFGNKSKGMLSILLYSSSLILTFSAGGILFAGLSFYLVFFVRLFNIGIDKKLKYLLITTAIGLCCLLILDLNGMINFIEPILNKITLSEGSSVSDRTQRWAFGFELLNESPIAGLGLGYLSSIGLPSVTSWYLFMVIENGIISLFLLIVLFLSYFKKILSLKGDLKYFFLFGFFSSIMHLSIVSTFHHPFLWCSIALFCSIAKKSKSTKNLDAQSM